MLPSAKCTYRTEETERGIRSRVNENGFKARYRGDNVYRDRNSL